MHRPDFTPVNNSSLMRDKFNEISMHMEEKMGHHFFCCDAVLDSKSRQIAIFSGYAKEMMPESWKVADKRTYVHWAEKSMMCWYLACRRNSIMATVWAPIPL